MDPPPIDAAGSIRRRWTHTRGLGRQVARGYSKATFCGDAVIGTWFCLDAETGQLRWSRWHLRPDFISGFVGGNVIATELVEGSGVWAFRLSDGRCAWANHGTGLRGWIARALTWIPLLDSGLCDAPKRVEGGLLLTRSGRWLDGRTGREVPPPADAAEEPGEAPPSVRLDAEVEVAGDRLHVVLGEGVAKFRRTRPDGQEVHRQERGRLATDPSDPRIGPSEGVLPVNHVLHDNDPGATYGSQRGDFDVSWHVGPRWIWVLASDGPVKQAHPRQAHVAVPLESRWTLFAFDTGSDRVLQRSLGDEGSFAACRIEDARDGQALLSFGERRLHLYEVNPVAVDRPRHGVVQEDQDA